MQVQGVSNQPLSHLSPQDQALFWEYGIGRKLESPFQCVHQAFEYQAHANPNSVAVEDMGRKINYKILSDQANCFAAKLREMGVSSGWRVALLVEHSISMVVGMLAVLKAGGTYIPLDGHSLSDSALKCTLEDADAAIVIVQGKLARRVPNMAILSLDTMPCNHAIYGECTKPEDRSTSEDIAYINYIHGTTGIPKGIEITHENIINLVCHAPANLGMQPGVRVSQFMNTSLGMAAWEILGSMCNGSTLCLNGTSLEEWQTVLAKVEVVIASASMLGPHNPEDYPNIKVIAVSGEPCPQSIADRWAARGVKFYNTYGSAETTVVNMMSHHKEGRDVRISRPTPNNYVYILDDNMRPVPIGQTGVIWAGGKGVSRGYLNLPEKTVEKYKPDPFRNNGSVIFNTGDQGRWTVCGNLEFIGKTEAPSSSASSDTASDIDQPQSRSSSRASTIVQSALPSVEEVVLKEEYAWSGYLEDPLPEKTQGSKVRNLRHQVWIYYRRLFSFVFIANLGVFIYFCLNKADTSLLGRAVLVNLFITVMMRQEYVVNLLFNIFCAVPRSWPLTIRRIAARIFHLGGVHSGTGVAGTVWLVLFVGKATKEISQREGKVSIATLVVSYVILVVLITMIAFAYPKLRQRMHNDFEHIHRFFGWTVTGLAYAQVVLLANDYKSVDRSLGRTLIHAYTFWLTVVLSGSIVLPWLRLRHYTIKAERLSNHACRLYFDYTTPKPGSFVRLSTDPLFEWHSFATVAVPGQKGFSVIISSAGDWTNKQIAELPTKMWIRGIPCFGVMRVVPVFSRVIIVATGSGIAPCCPVILAGKSEHRLLWTSPNVRQTFGDKLVDTILDKSPNAVLYDTRVHGKPDMVKLTYRLYKEFKAEAVFIISNEVLTEKVVYGLTSRGIPAFGAIWDS